MTIIDFFKIKWREALAIEEEKEAFFRGCKKLMHSKHYDRLFRDFRHRGEVLFYSTEQDILYLKTKDDIIVSTDKYYAIFLEIFIDKIYTIPPQMTTKDFVVFDMGMNRGYASLYFANHVNCTHVYGFELMEETFRAAVDNFNLNPHLKNKITPFNYGLWDNDGVIDVEIDGIDGHTSITGVPNNITKNKKKQASVKKASSALSGIFHQMESGIYKILKIDVEGSEYIIFKDLYENKLIQEFDLVIGEYHNGLDNLKKYLLDFNCLYNETISDGHSGIMSFINKKYNI
jgi:FkbM family methyltransferase